MCFISRFSTSMVDNYSQTNSDFSQDYLSQDSITYDLIGNRILNKEESITFVESRKKRWRNVSIHIDCDLNGSLNFNVLCPQTCKYQPVKRKVHKRQKRKPKGLNRRPITRGLLQLRQAKRKLAYQTRVKNKLIKHGSIKSVSSNPTSNKNK